MAVVCNNPVNSAMKNPPLNVGVLYVPNSHPQVELYSDRQAERDFHQMDMDIYQHRSKYSPAKDKKLPAAIWAALGLGGAFGVYKLIKHCFKK